MSTLPGIDALAHAELALLREGTVGLVTNHTGLDHAGRSTLDALRARGVRVGALFAPEHGVDGTYQAGVAVSHTARAGLPVWSLYGDTKRPTPEMLRGIDVLAFDVQDAGARPYTYLSTLVEVLRAAAEHAQRVVVFDRPNPSGGLAAEGPPLEDRFRSFVGAGPLPLRYGMTIGEAALYLNAELGIGAELAVARLRGWVRRHWYDETGLRWVAPSPSLRSVAAIALYPGLVLLEGTTLSEGRGTDLPFEWAGAPWLDGAAWATRLNALDLPGARFHPLAQTPRRDRHAGAACGGVRIAIVERMPFQTFVVALAVIATARELAPGKVRFDAQRFDHLAGTDRVRKWLAAGRDPREIAAAFESELDAFRAKRDRVLLY